MGTVHTYREEWDSGTDIYATDAETGKGLMTYIVQCMRASGRYRGELFGTLDDEVEADYAGLGKFYRGNIARDRGDGTYDIVYYRYDDGGRVRETRVAERLIRKLGV